jgi:inorganic pyrophosphatase
MPSPLLFPASHIGAWWVGGVTNLPHEHGKKEALALCLARRTEIQPATVELGSVESPLEEAFDMRCQHLTLLTGAMLVLVCGVSIPALADQPATAPALHPFTFPQPEEFPDEIHAVIEIPAGSFIKYEIDEDTGHIFVDRFVSMPVAYPMNYGSITRSLGGDGDPLDVLVITRAPVVPGSIIKVRPLGMLKMIDGGDIDDKLIAVPAAKIDPTYADIASVDDLPEMERRRIEEFFRVYKQLPSGGNVIELNGYENAATAQQLVKEAVERYGSETSAGQ